MNFCFHTQTNTKMQVIMTKITTVRTFLEPAVTQFAMGYLGRSEKGVKFDGETLVFDWTLLNSEIPFDCGAVLDGQTVLDVETATA